jgi:hydrogenase-4 membrane subunit HyfE
LIATIRQFRPESQFDLIPANLMLWIIAVTLILMGYWLGRTTAPEDLIETFHIGTVAATILMGLLILSSNEAPLGQMIGVLTLESGILLADTLLKSTQPPIIEVGLASVFLASVFLFAHFLRRLSTLESLSESAPETEVF